MADTDVIRLKAHFQSAEAQAQVRALGRELGALPRHAGQGVKQVGAEMLTLTERVKSLGASVTSALPALAALARTGGPIGAVIYLGIKAAQSVTEFGKSLVQLKYLSKELGLTTKEVHGLQTAAERAGIAPEEMTAALTTFKKNTEDFSLRIGTVREEMHKIGATDLLDRIVKSTSTMEALKHAFDFADAAEKAGKPEVGRRVLEMLTGNAKLARDLQKTLAADIAAAPFISDEELERGQRYNDLMITLGRSWEHLKQKFVLGLFDTTRWEQEKERFKDFGAGPVTPEVGAGTGLSDMGIPQFQHGGYMPNTGLALLHAGETVVPAGGDLLKGSGDTLTATTREGTFQGLVQFAAYQQAAVGGGGGAGFGGIPGLGGGSVGGGGGGGAGGGGGGGDGATDSTATPSASELMSPGKFPMSMQPLYRGDGAGLSIKPSEAPAAPPASVTGGVEPKGGGRIGYNYFQKRGDPAIRDPSKLATIVTPYGKLKVHPEAAQDFAGFYKELHEAGAPIKKLGTYNYRPKRWGGGMSSHAYASAHDIDDQVQISPAMRQWMLANPDKWKSIKERYNIGQPLADQSGTRGKDPAHVEWRGRPRGDARRIDTANDAQSQPPGARGQVDVNVKSTGAGKNLAETGKDLFQGTTINQHVQMGRTEDAGGVGHQ